MTQHRIVLTGGPCGGKTTAMARIAERLENLGFRVFMVPETPTMLFQGGFSLTGVTEAQVVELETTLLQTVMNTEESFQRIASVYNDPKTVFLCDRGMMDTKAYVTPQMWQTILDNLGQSEVQLRDQRYEAVIHMVTAADGAEEYYTLANNTARTETPEQARKLDRKTQDAWVGHPHLRVVNNFGDFEDKVRDAMAAMCRILGVPEPMEDERKFLVASVDEIPVKNVTVDIEQVYLVPTNAEDEERVRKRGRDNSYVYTHTTKHRREPGSAAEFDRMITPAEHLMALNHRDPDCATIRKKRTCFLWEGRYFELDVYTDWLIDGEPLKVMELEVEDLRANVTLPPFVKIEREVTGESAFSNRELARSLHGHVLSDLLRRMKDQGNLSIALRSEEEADFISNGLLGLTEGFNCTGLNPRKPGQPYVLTLESVAIFD